MDEIYGAALKKAAGGVIFDLSTEGGVARWKALHDRVIEHVRRWDESFMLFFMRVHLVVYVTAL